MVGQIGTFPGGTHGIGIATATGHGYTDDGKAGTVGVFDLATLKPVRQIAAAPDADGIVFDPASGHIFVINGDSGSITVIDPAKNAAVANIKVGAGLEAGEVDGTGKLYVDGTENHEIIEIDTRKNTVAAHWPMPDCRRPHGIAVDPAARRIFATCVNNVLVVVDADNGANIATLPIGSSSDGAAFDPIRKLIFSSNGEGTLTVIRKRTRKPSCRWAPSRRFQARELSRSMPEPAVFSCRPRISPRPIRRRRRVRGHIPPSHPARCGCWCWPLSPEHPAPPRPLSARYRPPARSAAAHGRA